MFVIDGENIKNPIDSMPNIYQYSIDNLKPVLDEVVNNGILGVLLFGIPSHKDECGSGAYDENGITQRAIRYIKQEYPQLLVVADVCLCEYTSHGHCGLVKDGKILNDETLPLLCKMAVTTAQAGADIIAPSDMMDGRVEAIRKALDENHLEDVAIMSYSAKYSSSYYSPFRDAAHSAPSFGDRKTYQMDFHNGKEALCEVLDDLDEGADIVMVKPALAYLDVVKEVSNMVECPVAVYNVSGECSMVKSAGANGWIDEKKIIMENMVAFKRAGAKIIITYHAIEVAKWLNE
jgi:porphobilinogen synthase